MSFVYILLSLKDQRTYTGSTTNLQNRIKEHNAGKSKSTKNRRPLKLIYSEVCETIEVARRREKYFKTKKGRREINKFFER